MTRSKACRGISFPRPARTKLSCSMTWRSELADTQHLQPADLIGKEVVTAVCRPAAARLRPRRCRARHVRWHIGTHIKWHGSARAQHIRCHIGRRGQDQQSPVRRCGAGIFHRLVAGAAASRGHRRRGSGASGAVALAVPERTCRWRWRRPRGRAGQRHERDRSRIHAPAASATTTPISPCAWTRAHGRSCRRRRRHSRWATCRFLCRRHAQPDARLSPSSICCWGYSAAWRWPWLRWASSIRW